MKTKISKNKHSEIGDYVEEVRKIMRKNDKFLLENGREYLETIFFFVSVDVIGYVTQIASLPNLKKHYQNWAMCAYIFHVLPPVSYGILIDLLVGNLPNCFFGLRVLLETLAKSYYADAKYPSHLNFKQKFQFLENESKKRTTSQIMKEVDNLLMLNNKCYSIWKETSSKWIHSEGIIDKVFSKIMKNVKISSWNVIVPCLYDKNDLPEIADFYKLFSDFKEINKEAIESWKSFLK